MAWYEEFFGEDYMRFHLCGGESTDQRAPAECDFVVSALSLAPGARVLDLCCGQGRHCLELARRGFRVTGLDLSEYLLGLAEGRASEQGMQVEFVRRDMRDLPWRDEFDAVVNMFTAFGYLESDGEDERVLEAVHGALRPGGLLLLDLPTREGMAARPAGRDWYEHEGCLVLDADEWDPVRGRWSKARTIVEPDGQRRECGFSLRIYCHSEIMAMLDHVGLEWQRTYGGHDSSDYGATSRRMLIVARKPEEAPA